MRSLATLRGGWDEVEKEERRIERETTIEDNVRDFLSLCEIAAPHLAATEELFRPVRGVEIMELRLRLLRLDKWREKHRGPGGEPF